METESVGNRLLIRRRAGQRSAARGLTAQHFPFLFGFSALLFSYFFGVRACACARRLPPSVVFLNAAQKEGEILPIFFPHDTVAVRNESDRRSHTHDSDSFSRRRFFSWTGAHYNKRRLWTKKMRR